MVAVCVAAVTVIKACPGKRALIVAVWSTVTMFSFEEDRLGVGVEVDWEGAGVTVLVGRGDFYLGCVSGLEEG